MNLSSSSFHDVMAEVLLKRGFSSDQIKAKITEKLLQKAYDSLPVDIRAIAFAWGLEDTVFRDDAFVWLLAHWE